MIRTLSIAERNTQIDPPRVITLAAGVAQVAFLDERKVPGEIASRFIQNTGANPLYYSIGSVTDWLLPSVDAVAQYHGILFQGQQLDCTNRQSVSVISPLGTTVATSKYTRI